ncbi:unnamed protein product [Oreochromis niloticus]|nr:unnamed protein product [Mustela putorius furo]
MSANPSFSSDELEIVEGSILGNHYKVEAFLGEGGFGIVAKCRDTRTNRAVAIKVNKSRPDILQQAKLEIFILEQLRRLDPDAANIVKWDGFFHDGERVCLNFELLDQCLWDYIRDRNNEGLPISEVGPILGQLTNALSHLGSVGIVHADLKSRNIMVVNRHESPIKVKLIDFGLACPASAVMPGDRVGTVGYSAPEVMLGLPFNEASDMWSLGLVAVELGTGLPLYPGNEDYDVLKFIIETQGQPPDHVLDSGVYTEDYFIEDNYKQQRWTFKTDQQFQYETGYESLETRYIKLKCLDDLEQVMKVRRGPENGQRLFVSLIKQMLALDANQRITPSEVLRHPFFDPKSSLCIDASSTRGQNPVVFQQPSNLKSKRSQKINCSFQNSVEFSQQVHINTSASPSFNSDELEIVEGSILGNHYKVEALLGEGGFGIVAKCRDTKTNQAIAIKVNKSRPDVQQEAKLEIFILEQLRKLDPDAANIVKWNGFFQDGERVCLKFELLDQCLWDYIRDRNKQGLPISEFRPILGQLTNALSHLGSVGIVHADLKPGNIMVVNRHETPVKVRLIDFGLACPASAVNPSDCVGTVGYSAPEVVLGLPYNEASDMWSLGLVAVELATGVPLYPAENEYDYLKFIIETQGQPPDHVLDSGVYTDDYFIEDNCKQQRWTFKTDQQFQYETGYPSLETRYIKLKCLDDLEQIMKVRRGPEDGQSLFVSLIKKMLALDAHQRITPSEVLRHPFFNPGLSNRFPCIAIERPHRINLQKGETKVWIIGSSYIRRGESDANEIFGENFGLNAKVQWFGKGGMRWSGVLPRFYEELSTQSPPDILVIHAGGNDLGLMSAYQLSSVIEKELMQLHTEFPSMTIVYSSINERQVWRYGNPGKINKDRNIVNATIRKAVNRFAGVIIEHPCLRFFNNSIFLPDGVHLNKKGNALFLKSIRSAIQQSLQSPHRKLT